jgi:hypothetical protein
MTKDEALKLALDDLIAEYHMETSSFAKRVDEIFKQALASQPAVQEPVLEVVNGQINRAWDAIPAGFTGMLYMQSQSNFPPKKPQEPWYGSARVDDYNRGWNDCVDAITATPQTAHIPQPWGTYMGHRMTPTGTKEFWGFADAPLPEGTKLDTTPPAAQPAPWVDIREIDIMAEAKHWRNPEAFINGAKWAQVELKGKNT